MRVGLRMVFMAELACLVFSQADYNTSFIVKPKDKLESIRVPENGLPVNTSKYEEEEEFFIAEDPKLRLKSFNNALRYFISEEGFDYFDFETRIEELRNEISDIEFFAETELRDSEVKHQISLARKMFSSMVYATDKLKRYSRYDSLVYNLVHQMLEIHIRALSLFDYRGFVDVEFEGFPLEMSNIYLSVYIWEKDFKKITNVPPGIRKVFENALKQVKKIFEAWRHQLAKLA